MTITIIQDTRLLIYPMSIERVRQAVRLTYTIGPRGENRPWSVWSVPPVSDEWARYITVGAQGWYKGALTLPQ